MGVNDNLHDDVVEQAALDIIVRIDRYIIRVFDKTRTMIAPMHCTVKVTRGGSFVYCPILRSRTRPRACSRVLYP